jgi:hypothetical protein
LVITDGITEGMGHLGWARGWTGDGLYSELSRDLEGTYETVTGHLAYYLTERR